MTSFLKLIISNPSKIFWLTPFGRFIDGDLFTGLMFLVVLVFSGWLNPEIVEGISNCIMLEFLIIHANVGMAVGGVVAKNERNKRLLILGIGSFYSLFVVAMAWALAAWWLALIFLSLTWSRFNQPLNDENKKGLMTEIFVTMIRFAIYMVAAVLAFGILALVGLEDEPLMMLLWGFVYYFTLFLVSKWFARLRKGRFLDDIPMP